MELLPSSEGINMILVSASFEAFTAVMFQVEVFWVLTPYSVVV
jgi:hypothetical protein